MSKALPKGGSALCYVQGSERPAHRPVCPIAKAGGGMMKRNWGKRVRPVAGAALAMIAVAPPAIAGDSFSDR
jgi:hypothetical protein